jgi:hypothetical protein
MTHEELEIKYIEALLYLAGKDKKIETLEKRVKELEYQLYLKNAGYTTAEGTRPFLWTSICPVGCKYKTWTTLGELDDEGDPNEVTV